MKMRLSLCSVHLYRRSRKWLFAYYTIPEKKNKKRYLNQFAPAQTTQETCRWLDWKAYQKSPVYFSIRLGYLVSRLIGCPGFPTHSDNVPRVFQVAMSFQSIIIHFNILSKNKPRETKRHPPTQMDHHPPPCCVNKKEKKNTHGTD